MVKPLILVGAGKLGHSLCCTYFEFERKGFKIVAALDSDPTKCGHQLGHIKNVQHISTIKRVIKDYGAKIVILAIPGEKAQEVTKLCVEAGISTILNYSPVALTVPKHVHVEYMDPAFKIQMVLNIPSSPFPASFPPAKLLLDNKSWKQWAQYPFYLLPMLLVPLILYMQKNKKAEKEKENKSKPSLPFSLLSYLGEPRRTSSPFSLYTYLSQPGSRYGTDFEELGLLGQGGFGSVFRVLNRIDGMQYAVKKIRVSVDARSIHDITEHKFLREVKAMARMCHQNVVRYCYAWMELVPPSLNQNQTQTQTHENSTTEPSGTESGLLNTETHTFTHTTGAGTGTGTGASGVCECNDEGEGSQSESVEEEVSNVATSQQQSGGRVERIKALLFIQMELCGGFTLKKWLARSERMVELSECKSILTQILRGLHHIHSHGFIHRDVTPANLFLEKDVTLPPPQIVVKIGDFGLAKHCDDLLVDSPSKEGGEKHERSDKTKGVGTYLYASPEQLSRKFYNNKTDLYSVGVIFFELLSVFQTQVERITTLTQLKKGHIPPQISILYPNECEIIRWLLQEEPTMRPSALDVLSRYNV